MSSSSIPGHGTADGPSARSTGLLASVSRYDAALAAIPLLFAATLVVQLLLPVSVWTATAAGTAGAVAILTDALYLNPPSGPGPGTGSDGLTR